jgi:hypothetical protein
MREMLAGENQHSAPSKALTTRTSKNPYTRSFSLVYWNSPDGRGFMS